MSFYGNLATTAKTLLTKYGRSVTRRRNAEGSYDADTGSVSQTPTDVTFKGAPFSFGAGQSHVRGTLVQVEDKQLLLEAAGTPLLSDIFIIDSVNYTVVSIAEVNPGGTAVVYDLHLRRGA